MQRGTSLHRMSPAHGMTSWLKNYWLSKPARRLNSAPLPSMSLHKGKRALKDAVIPHRLFYYASLPSFWKHLHRSANASVFHVLVSRCLLSEFSWFLQGTLLNQFHFFLLLLENWRISPKTPRKCNPKAVSSCLLGLIFDWRFSLPWLFLH